MVCFGSDCEIEGHVSNPLRTRGLCFDRESSMACLSALKPHVGAGKVLIYMTWSSRFSFCRHVRAFRI